MSTKHARKRTRRGTKRTPAFQRDDAAAAAAAAANPAAAFRESLRTELGTTIREAFQEAGQGVLQELLGDLRAGISEVTQPDRSTLREIAGPARVERPPAGQVQTRFPWEHLYDRLSPAARRIRTPEIDFDMARWIRAVTEKDVATSREIAAKYGTGSWVHDDGRIEGGERATMAEGTTTAVSGLSGGTGGPLIPLPLANTIILARDLAAKMRAVATPFTSAAKTLRVPGSGVATAAIVAEGGSGTQGEPLLGSTLFDKRKMRAKFRASEEQLEDSPFSIVSFFAERAGSAFGALEDLEASADGDGTATHFSSSLDNETITAITLDVAVTIDYEEMVKLFYALPEGYHAGAAWFCNSAFAQMLSQLLDANGRPIFSPGDAPAAVVGDGVVAPGQTASIFGRPIYVVQTQAGSLYFGNPSYFGFLDGGGVRMRVLDQVAAATDDIEYRFTMRTDFNVMLAAAFRSMDGVTTVA